MVRVTMGDRATMGGSDKPGAYDGQRAGSGQMR